MRLLPNPADIDAVARGIAAHAAATRATAHRLERDTAAIGSGAWQGTAEAAFSVGAAETAAALRHAAVRLDDAAHALHRHARAVEHAVHGLRALALQTGRALDDLATSVEHDATTVVSGAAHLIGI